MVGRTIWSVGLIAALTLIFGVAAAAACENPELSLGKSAAGPGDPVPFTIAPSELGSTYVLTIDGQPVEGGTGEDTTKADGASGTFVMPQSATSGATVEMVLTHEAPSHSHNGSNSGPWSDSATIAPLAAAVDPPAQQPEAPAEETAPDQAQPPAAEQPNESNESGQGSESGFEQPQGQAPPTQPGAAGGQGGASTGTGVSADAAATSAAGTPASSLGQPSPVSTEGTSSGAARGASGPESASARGASQLGGSLSLPLDEVISALPVAPALPTAAGPVPTGVAVPVGAISLLAVALCGTGLLLFMRRRFGADGVVAAELPAPWIPPAISAEAQLHDALVEAELQEILAEERAKSLLSSPAEPDDIPRSSAAGSRKASIV